MTGVYPTIATLAFTLIIQEVFTRWDQATGGLKGKAVDKAVVFGLSFGNDVTFYFPYRDTLSPMAQAWFDRYKERYKTDPNIGAVYGHVAADLTVVGLERAGKDLTLDSFVKGLESIKGYKHIFNGPGASLGPDKRQGANSSFLAVVKAGRWVRLTAPLGYGEIRTAARGHCETPWRRPI